MMHNTYNNRRRDEFLKAQREAVEKREEIERGRRQVEEARKRRNEYDCLRVDLERFRRGA